jgi:hypothetical protein
MGIQKAPTPQVHVMRQKLCRLAILLQRHALNLLQPLNSEQSDESFVKHENDQNLMHESNLITHEQDLNDTCQYYEQHDKTAILRAWEDPKVRVKVRRIARYWLRQSDEEEEEKERRMVSDRRGEERADRMQGNYLAVGLHDRSHWRTMSRSQMILYRNSGEEHDALDELVPRRRAPGRRAGVIWRIQVSPS